MILPAAFQEQYDTVFPYMEALTSQVGGWLSDTLKDLNAKVDARPKTAESVLMKMRLGRHDSMLDMLDLVAAKVVLLNLGDRDKAVKFVKDALPIVDATGLEGDFEPYDFSYKEPHLVVSPMPAWTERHPEWGMLSVEIQFTTSLQYALNQSLHDITYKNGRFSWRASRMDAQLRGVLETSDVLIASFEDTAAALPEKTVAYFAIMNEIRDTLDAHFAEHDCPEDMRRMSIVVKDMMDAAGMAPQDLDAALSDETAQDIMATVSLSPPEKVMATIVRACGQDFCDAYSSGRRVCISSEMRSLFPTIANLFPEAAVLDV